MRVAVDVWRIDLAGAPAPSAGELELLDDAERRRHASYLVPEPARLFATTRIALRRILGRALDCPPATLRISVDAQGKPLLPDHPGVFFNVSHCAATAAIALCRGRAVGVDVEDRLSVGASGALAGSICAPAETARLPSDPARRADVLARLWVRKEALLKAAGTGLSRGMAHVDLGPPAATQGAFVGPGEARVLWCDVDWIAGAAAIAVVDAEATAIDVARRHGTQ